MKIDRHFDAACQAWEYADEELHDIALQWIFDHGFNLASFDDWIEDAGTAPARRAQLLQWRQHAIDAERTGNHAAAEMGVRFLAELHKRHRHESVLIPPAVRGEDHSRAQRARRQGKPASQDQIDLHGATRNDDVRRHHMRLVETNHPSPTDDTATHFGLSRRTVQRILKDPPG